jgi:hypothetical protein
MSIVASAGDSGLVSRRQLVRDILNAQASRQAPSGACYVVPIAWPVFAWRALAPKLANVKCDPLRRAILRLTRASVTRSRDMSSLLGCDERLVEQLLAGLRQEELVEADGSLTRNGNAVLENDEAVFFKDKEAVLGWIFRDALTGDALPIFHQGSLTFRGDQHSFEPLPFDPALRQKPSTVNVAEAMKTYGDFVNRQAQDEGHGDTADPTDDRWGDDHEVPAPSDVPRVSDVPEAVRLISRDPELIDVPTWFYFSPEDPANWRIRSAFSLAEMDYWLERRFSYAEKSFCGIRELIAQWRAAASEVFPPEPRVESEEEQLDHEMPFLGHKGLERLRRHMACARRAEQLFHTNHELFDLVLVRYYKAVEAALSAAIGQLDRRTQIARFIAPYDAFDAQVENFATAMGQSIRPKISRGALSRLAERESWNPRVNAAVLLFHAGLFRNSIAMAPFVEEPRLLEFIDYVTECRNHYGGHDSEDRPMDEPEMVATVRARTNHVVEVIGKTIFREGIN